MFRYGVRTLLLLLLLPAVFAVPGHEEVVMTRRRGGGDNGHLGALLVELLDLRALLWLDSTDTRGGEPHSSGRRAHGQARSSGSGVMTGLREAALC